jgi:hypothetical protein
VTVVASLALAFMVVRQLQPFAIYAPSTHIPVLPLAVVAPLIAIAICMHSEWLRLGTSGSAVQAQVAGDALYGSGLVILGLWLAVGLWIGALMVNRSLMITIASGLTAVISVIVGMYAMFVWGGGRLLDWLIPAKLERWTAVSVEPQLYIVLLSTVATLVISVLGLFPKMHQAKFALGTRAPSSARVYTSDVVGGFILAAIAASVVWQLI